MTTEEKKARVFEALDWLRNDPENLSAYTARLILNLLDIPHTVEELNEWAMTDPTENIRRHFLAESTATHAAVTNATSASSGERQEKKQTISQAIDRLLGLEILTKVG